MIYLLLVTLIWGFSFGLVKGILAGVDPFFVSLIRLAVALFVFLPFVRLKKIPKKVFWVLLAIGAIQFGLMYVAYNAAFQHLKAYEVAILTITTPLFVVFFQSGFEKRIEWLFLLTSLIACIGAGIIVYGAFTTREGMLGVLMVQASNLCFAYGQVRYRSIMATIPDLADHQVFGMLYLGAVIATGALSAFLTPWSEVVLTTTHILTLLYLGAIASGISFFLWDLGARKVNTGALAIMNDLKIPVAIAISLLVFGERTDWKRLLIGGCVILFALILNQCLTSQRKTGEIKGKCR